MIWLKMGIPLYGHSQQLFPKVNRPVNHSVFIITEVVQIAIYATSFFPN
jgi:hypothetical protein